MDPEDYELAKVKIDRVIRLSEKFEDMNEDDLKRFLTILESVIKIIPHSYKNAKEREMVLKQFGEI